MPATKPQRRPIACAKCRSTDVTVAGAGNTRRIAGKTRKTQHVRCRNCGHEWQSAAKEALRLGRLADRAATAGR